MGIVVGAIVATVTVAGATVLQCSESCMAVEHQVLHPKLWHRTAAVCSSRRWSKACCRHRPAQCCVIRWQHAHHLTPCMLPQPAAGTAQPSRVTVSTHWKADSNWCVGC